MYFIHKINEFKRDNGKHLLPTCEFVLTRGISRYTVIGFLPCHHSNVGYELELRKNKIFKIISMKHIKKKSVLPKLRSDQFPNYTEKALQALEYQGLWVVSVIYPLYELKKMDIDWQFNALVDDIERCCRRGFPHAQCLYDVESGVELINQALISMGQTPYNDIVGFKKRMLWQLKTRYDTAKESPNIPQKENPSGEKVVGFKQVFQKFKPIEKYDGIIKYKDVYSTQDQIDSAEEIAAALTPRTKKLIRGSLEEVSGNIVVLNLEDAYRVRCQTGNRCQIFMLEMPDYTFYSKHHLQFFLRRRGIGDIKLLPTNIEHVHVAWSHLWGVEDFLKLITFESMSYTLIGRLDQYQGSGRGQIYRDMLECGLFETQIVKHVGTDNVICLESDDLVATINDIVSKHETVQCFTTDNSYNYGDIDTGRVGLTNPFRIRSKRDRNDTHKKMRYPDLPLFEEYSVNERVQKDNMRNASVVSIKRFRGVHVHAAVFICSERTTAFDVAVAKTYCREALYLINGGNYMLLKNEAPQRITVNPFCKQ